MKTQKIAKVKKSQKSEDLVCNFLNGQCLTTLHDLLGVFSINGFRTCFLDQGCKILTTFLSPKLSDFLTIAASNAQSIEVPSPLALVLLGYHFIFLDLLRCSVLTNMHVHRSCLIKSHQVAVACLVVAKCQGMILLAYSLVRAQLSSPTQYDCPQPSATASFDDSRASKSGINVRDPNFRSKISGL